MPETVIISKDKLKEIKSSLKKALRFIDGLEKEGKVIRISKAEERRIAVRDLLNKKLK